MKRIYQFIFESLGSTLRPASSLFRSVSFLPGVSPAAYGSVRENSLKGLLGLRLWSSALAALALCLSGCGGEGDDGGGEGGGAVPFVRLSPSGVVMAEAVSGDSEYTLPVTVRRVGKGDGSSLSVRLGVWSASELEAYNREEGTSYSLLPAELYSVSPSELSVGDGTGEASASVSFSPSEVFSLVKETGGDYAIPLRLESGEAKVMSSESGLLVAVSLSYPEVSFSSAGTVAVSVGGERVEAEIPTSFRGGETSGSPLEFTCGLTVAEDASGLVERYNSENRTSYSLLPEGSYSLGEVRYGAGDSEASGTLTVLRERLSAGESYLLPLRLGECSDGSVLCGRDVQYVSLRQTYANPVLDESHADPTVIRAEDGYYYMYSTESGGRNDGMGIYRSADLVSWEWAGQVLHDKFPAWSVKSEYDLWAPEIRRIGERYVIYYSVAKWGETQKCKIGVADAPSPTGPFRDKGEPLITYEETGVDNCIDPFYWEEDGRKYLFWGSFKGVYVTELTDDGMSVRKDSNGEAVLLQKVAGSAFEATCVYKRNGYYYLLASVGSCCEGANSTYRVVVGRSESLLGPYTDKDGGRMLDDKYELVLQGDDRWAGPGHCSQIVTDDAGAEWMVYHAYRKSDPDGGRLLMLDRLRWTDDGWPYVTGKTPSEEAELPVINGR